MVEEQLRLDIDRESILVQSNSLIMANYDMTAMEQKLFLLLVSTINKNDKDIKTTSFRVKDIADVMDISTQVLYRDLSKICKSLMSRIVEIKIGDKDWDIFNIIKYAKYRGKKGIVTFEINERAKPYLLELKELFSIIQLDQVLMLEGKYTLRIYQQAKSNIYLGKYDMTVDDFKEKLKLTQKSYNQFSNIKLKILTPAIKEINDKTDIFIDVEEIKVGRKVNILRFKVRNKKNKQQKVIVKSNKNNNGFNNFSSDRNYTKEQMKYIENKLLGW